MILVHTGLEVGRKDTHPKISLRRVAYFHVYHIYLLKSILIPIIISRHFFFFLNLFSLVQ